MKPLYIDCACGKTMTSRSKKCRQCWLDDKASLKKHGQRIGFKPGYTPWNKGTKGLTSWKPERREKIMSFLLKGGGMKGKKHKIETRLALSAKTLGENSPNWQGGITKLNKGGARNTIERRLWLEACLKRDDYTCQVCLKRGSRLEVHHIKTWSKYPELRLEVSNGITLCVGCHKLTLHKEKFFEAFFLNIGSLEKESRLETFRQCSPKRG